MFKADIARHVGVEGPRLVLLLLGVHDVGDTVDGNARLAHLRDHAAQHTDRPDQQLVVGQKGDVFARDHPTLETEDRAENHYQHHLQTGKHVRRTPVGAHHARKLDPKAGVVLVVRLKAILFIALAAESAHHTHAGEVLLRHGRELALVLVAVEEARADLLVETQRIGDDKRHRQKGDQRQQRVHADHECQREHQQNRDTEQRGQLLGHKALERVNVRGAALDDVAGAVLHVPAEGQTRDVGVEPVAHRFDQGFRALGIADAEQVLPEHAEEGHDHDGDRHDPQMLPQIGKAAEALHQRNHRRGQPIRWLAADHMVQRDADDLGVDHLRQRAHRRGQNRHGEEALAAAEKIQDQRSIAFCLLFVRFHMFCPEKVLIASLL